MRQVIGGAYPGNLGRDVEHGRGQLAGDQVGLVALGDRENHVGVAGSGAFQGFRMAGIADYGAQVEAILQFAQATGIGIDDGDVVGFGYQILGHGTADLAGAEDDDAQTESPCGSTGWRFRKKRNCIPGMHRDAAAGRGPAAA